MKSGYRSWRKTCWNSCMTSTPRRQCEQALSSLRKKELAGESMSGFIKGPVLYTRPLISYFMWSLALGCSDVTLAFFITTTLILKSTLFQSTLFQTYMYMPTDRGSGRRRMICSTRRCKMLVPAPAPTGGWRRGARARVCDVWYCFHCSHSRAVEIVMYLQRQGAKFVIL